MMLGRLCLGFILLGLFSASSVYAVERVSVSNDNVQANGISYLVNSSRDGRYVVFDSLASNLVNADTNNARDIFMRDRNTGITERISLDHAGNQSINLSRFASVSDDGRYVSFESWSPLVPGTTEYIFQIYRRDRQTGTTELVSASRSGVAGNANSMRSSLSSDGRYVLFYSLASNLIPGDSQNSYDVFLKDMQSGDLERISVSTGGAVANGDSFEAAMSPDARYVTFISMATNLTGSTIARQRHVYLRDRTAGTTVLVTRDVNGSPANQASFAPELSDDGRYVVYYSLASNLTGGTSGTAQQVLLFDANSSTTTLLSKNLAGQQGNDLSYSPSINGDGRYVAFTSYASNFGSGDNAGVADVFLWERDKAGLQLISQSATGSPGNGHAISTPRLSGSGNSISFISYANNLVDGDSNNLPDVFVHDLITNSKPLANAGADQLLQCSGSNTPVSLDGRASSDADGDPLSYTWTLTDVVYEGAVVTVPMALGTHTATLSVDDQRGGVGHDDVVIDIVDTVAPELVLAAEAVLEADSRSGRGYTLQAVGSDLCSGVSLAISPSMAIYPLGETLVSVNASDASGNSRVATQRVRVEDTTAPSLTVPGDIHREATARQELVDIGTATATDIFDVAITHDAPASFTVGTTRIHWSATDSNGNLASADQLVTVADTTAPVFGLLATQIHEATALRTPIVLPTPVVTDIFSVSVTHNAPVDFALGNTTVNWRAEDEHGNVSQADQLITIQDTVAPVLTAPSALVLEATGELTPVQPGTATATDIFPVTIEHDAPSSLPLGQHRVTWTATDSSGNRSQATQNILVEDTTAPLLEVAGSIVAEAQGSLTPVLLPAPKSRDLFAVTVTNNAPALFPLGSSLVTWLATDANGNQTQALQTVTVVDTTAPTADIEQLREVIWPPNNKLVEVARIRGLTDLVDSQPQLDVQVEWQLSGGDQPHKRRAHVKQEHRRLAHGKHDRRGGARAGQDDQSDAQNGRVLHGEHTGSAGHHRKSAWKLVQKGDVWHLYVRATTDGKQHQRLYNISINLKDTAGNLATQTLQVSVEHQHRDQRARHAARAKH